MSSTVTGRVTPFDAWCICTTIGKHFDGKYDCFKYNFKMKHLKPSKFEMRPDKYFYVKLAKNYPKAIDLQKYVVANVRAGNKWPKNMREQPYIDLQRTLQSFGYKFKSDLTKLHGKTPSLNYWLTSDDGQMPPIIKEVMSDDISCESMVIIDSLTGFMDNANKVVTDPLIWKEAYTMTQKYKPFIVSWINITIFYKKLIIGVFTP